jgi:putative ABC transport system substrate-binding protein
MKRREFITLLGGATAWPLAGHTQQAMPVVGFMHAGVAAAHTHVVAALRQGLRESGYVEGRNLAIEYRWANNEIDRLPELAADLVLRQVDVIAATGGSPSALAAKAATSTIPIVLAIGADPVRLGLVTSLQRPGGNVTGVTFITTELMAKRLDLLREMAPQAATVAYLTDTRSVVGQEMLSEMLAAAGVLGRQLAVAEARSEREFDSAFATFTERRSDALVVGAADTGSELASHGASRFSPCIIGYPRPGRHVGTDRGPQAIMTATSQSRQSFGKSARASSHYLAREGACPPSACPARGLRGRSGCSRFWHSPQLRLPARIDFDGVL